MWTVGTECSSRSASAAEAKASDRDVPGSLRPVEEEERADGTALVVGADRKKLRSVDEGGVGRTAVLHEVRLIGACCAMPLGFSEASCSALRPLAAAERTGL